MSFSVVSHKTDEFGKRFCFICRKDRHGGLASGGRTGGRGPLFPCPDNWVRAQYKYPGQARHLRSDLSCAVGDAVNRDENMANPKPCQAGFTRNAAGKCVKSSTVKPAPTNSDLQTLILNEALQLSQFQQAAATADATQNQTLRKLEVQSVTPGEKKDYTFLLIIVVAVFGFLWLRNR